MNVDTFLEQFGHLADAPEGIKKLRELILDLAVRGKLVKQDPEDQPVDKLLDLMKSERKKLQDEKKIGKKKIEPLTSEDCFSIIPNSWEWCQLIDVAHDLGQKKPNKIFTYIDVSAIDKSSGTITDKVAITLPEDAPSRARKIVKKGTVIYSTVRPYLLNIAVIHQDYEPEPIVSTAFGVFFPYSGLDEKYLYYYFRSSLFTSYVEKQMKGVAYPAINDSKLLRGPIPLPPLAEQKRIVAKVDELMTLCDELETQQQQRQTVHAQLTTASLHQLTTAETPRQLTNAWQRIDTQFDQLFTTRESIEKLRQTILQLAVQGKLVPQDPEDEPVKGIWELIAIEKKNFNKRKKASSKHNYCESAWMVPEKWEWCFLDDICLNITDGFHNTPKKVGQGFPYITALHVKANKIDFEKCYFVGESDHVELFNKTSPRRNDILMVNIGAGAGTPAIINVDYGFSFKNIAILNIPKAISSRYLLLHLLCIKEKNFQEMTSGGAQPFLSLKKIRSIRVPIPPLSEQKRIVIKVEQLMVRCNQLEQDLVNQDSIATDLSTAMTSAVLSLS